MNKKLIAFTLVLLIAVGGLFAAPTMPTAVSVLMKSTVGEFLYHGFTHPTTSAKYQSSIPDLENAFSVTPSFTYGYQTNSLVKLKFTMGVTDFINQTDNDKKIAIDTVKKGSEVLTAVSGVYTVFTRLGNAETSTGEAVFSFFPNNAQVAVADQGAYVSTVTIGVAVDSDE